MTSRRIHLLHYTPASWSGGVNKWARDFMAGFPETQSWSWFDVPGNETAQSLPEHAKAQALSRYLHSKGLIDKDDVIIGDGFWCGDLLEMGYKNVISHSHGIWSHRLPWESDLPPEHPVEHAAQVAFRRKHLAHGGRLTAVSDFIAWSMREQWGFESTVINNGVDLDEWKPVAEKRRRRSSLIIHGVNDRVNENKGWSHIVHLGLELDEETAILSLDEAHATGGWGKTKQETLAQADLVVIPSGHEGNSMFCLEALACNVPIVAYDVGLPYRAKHVREELVGCIIDRRCRTPEMTLDATKTMLEQPRERFQPRKWVEQFSIQNFHKNWREYLTKEFP